MRSSNSYYPGDSPGTVLCTITENMFLGRELKDKAGFPDNEAMYEETRHKIIREFAFKICQPDTLIMDLSIWYAADGWR